MMVVNYRKGVAHPVLGQVDLALKEQTQFETSIPSVPKERYISTITSAKFLWLMTKYWRGNFFVALVRMIGLLTIWIRRWHWKMPCPSRIHALGALLMKHHHVAEAAAFYQAGLGLGKR